MRREDVAARLLLALDSHDDLALASVLDPDIRMLVDSGDATGGERRGRAVVARVLVNRLAMLPDASLRAVHVNGRPGIAATRRDGEVVAVLGIETGWRGGITALWLSTAPDKLTGWNRPGSH
ncbi:hypothetical protein ACFPER_09410 [Agromyces aurantiacus]|uniref:Siderophore-interacting protein n=1 Tax=Agromyces aurantiacus TaxID=165814 RepID=A0ABV9R5V0_9MICO|nr:hypothetical protein [Agromyces aurantiacus]MBM7503690.1 hypothetical protein [Agromyces aurantiacus]